VTPGVLTIVMYHYVRDVELTRHRGIKARRVDELRGQVEHLRAHHEIVSMQDVVASVTADVALPPDAALLTFDDGYREHATVVPPILEAAGVAGAFFPVGSAVVDGRVLAVNKIQFTLSAEPDHEALRDHVLARIAELRDDLELEEPVAYWEQFGVPNRSSEGCRPRPATCWSTSCSTAT
jgi:hypothetical protein